MHFSFFFVLAVLVAASLTALREVESSAQTFIQTYIHTDIHTYMHTYTYIHTYVYTYIHTYMYMRHVKSIKNVPFLLN
jgi:aminoglycoside N3'-acetyltransferase